MRHRPFVAASLALAASCHDSAAPASPVQASLEFCPESMPIWVAYQNEGSAWTRVIPNGAGRVEFLATPHVALALVYSGSTDVWYTTASTLQPSEDLQCFGSGTNSVTGSLTGVGSGSAIVSMHTRVAQVTNAFTLNELVDGPLDLVASRTPDFSSEPADRIVIRRDVSFADGEELAPIDFESAESMALVPIAVTVSGNGSDELRVDHSLITRTTYHPLHVPYNNSNSATVIVPAVPTAELGSEEYEVIDASSTVPGTLNGRGVTRYHRSAVNQSLALGAHLATPTLATVATSPRLRLRCTVPFQADYPTQLTCAFLQETWTYSVRVSAAYLGGSPASWELAMPDLSGVDGWNVDWGLDPDLEVLAIVIAFGEAGTFVPVPGDGATLRSAYQLFSANAASPPASNVASLPQWAARAVNGRHGGVVTGALMAYAEQPAWLHARTRY